MPNRRRPFLRAALAATILALTLATAAPASQPDTPRCAVAAVDAIAVTVSDLDASVEWYTRVLDADVASTSAEEGEPFARLTGVFAARARTADLRIGRETLRLVEFITPAGRPFPVGSRSNDRWFQHVAVIVADMDRAYERLVTHRVTHASPSPQTLPPWNAAAAGIEAFYFRDPDGHYLEVLEFPPGKGEPRWQSDERLFLGIDHTAIVVDDTEAALAFYQGLLGLTVAGRSENHGPEQERLNAVFPARLRITTLRAPAGPAIELLEYLTPRDGRPMPLDTRPNDLWHWHVVLRIDDTDALFAACRDAGGSPVSPGPQPRRAEATPPGRSLLARDPDGHALLANDQRP